MKAASDNLEFVKGFEVGGLPPLPYHFEEVLANRVFLPQYGLYGEKHFFVYSKNDLATAYYEKGEMQKSAAAVQEFFSTAANRKRYLGDYRKVIEEIGSWIAYVDSLDLDKLPEDEALDLLQKHFDLYARVCSFAIISNPRRLQALEDEARAELGKKVAGSKIDSYLARLAVSEKRSPLDEERADWYAFLRDARSQQADGALTEAVGSSQELQKLLDAHFQKYKHLTIGDGQWIYDKGYFDKNLETDKGLSLAEINEAILRIAKTEQAVLEDKKRLLEDLQIERPLAETMAFLSDLGHICFVYRTNGLIPMIKTMINLESMPIAKLGLFDDPLAFSWLTVAEFKRLTTGQPLPGIKQTLTARKGRHAEFLILVHRGEENVYHNDEARAVFGKLQPKIAQPPADVLTGNVAMKGKVKGRVCIYKWGDDMKQKLEEMEKHSVLVAGQTRPSMMPLIKKATAIITDEGGITSHAAIVARELGIPSIIGTVHATDALNDGDLVEVDADSGSVRRLSH